MRKVITYFFFISVGFFWGCLDFDRLIDYRETLYGGSNEFGKQVSLSRVANTGDGNSSFEKNSLFIQSANDFFMYQNPNSYWDHTFTFSEEGLIGDFAVSPNGEIIAIAVEPKDSSDTTIEFYIQNAGQLIKLDRDLGFNHITSTELLQEFQMMSEDLIALLFRDDSLNVNRVKLLRYVEELNSWTDKKGGATVFVDLVEENANKIEQFSALYRDTFDGEYYNLITVDEQNIFKFYVTDEWSSGSWWEPGPYNVNGNNQHEDSTFFVHSFSYNGLDLILSRIKNDSTYLEHYGFDEYYPNFYRTYSFVQDTIGFLALNSSIELVNYEGRKYVVVGNTADEENNINAAIRLFELKTSYDYETGSWDLLQELRGVDQFASSFDVSIEASTLVIGEPSNDFVSNNAGAVHVYDISLNETEVILDQEVNVEATGDYRDIVRLEWEDIGWKSGFVDRDPIGYKVLRRIWESGSDPVQIADLDSIDIFSFPDLYFIDTTASLDTNYVYTILPYNLNTDEEGDLDYHMVENFAVARPINTQINTEINSPLVNGVLLLDAFLVESVWEESSLLVNNSNPEDTIKIFNSNDGIYLGVNTKIPEDFLEAKLSVSIDTDKNLDWNSENEGVISFSHYLNGDNELMTTAFINYYSGSYPDIDLSNNVNLRTLWPSDFLISKRIEAGRLYQEIYIPFSEILFNLDQYESVFLRLGLDYTQFSGSFSETAFPDKSHHLVQETFYKVNLSTSTVNNEVTGKEIHPFELEQNYPNPFNPSTNISFVLPEAGLVQLMVYNLLGQEVANLVDGRMNSGNHSVNFDASQLSSGVYIYRLMAGDQSITKKMMLIK